MTREKQGRDLSQWKPVPGGKGAGKIRIIGGRFRGHQLEYSGDLRTRPMKDNIREALFNLVGGFVEGKLAIDLFAGTGAIGLEAISRGAAAAILVERHLPTARIIQRNVDALSADLPVQIDSADSYFWVRQFLKQPPPQARLPWVVFCSPPYSHFVQHKADLLASLGNLMQVAPAGSLIVVESDERFSPADLPDPEAWRIRHYAPATLSVWRNAKLTEADEID
jgi:16S rRNA (guanine(966)-N(2))-methyltransferase RsmD